jgi:hypothetical protein
VRLVLRVVPGWPRLASTRGSLAAWAGALREHLAGRALRGLMRQGPRVACNRQGRALCDQVAADHRKVDGLWIGYDSLNPAFPEAEIVAAGVSGKAEKRYSS